MQTTSSFPLTGGDEHKHLLLHIISKSRSSRREITFLRTVAQRALREPLWRLRAGVSDRTIHFHQPPLMIRLTGGGEHGREAPGLSGGGGGRQRGIGGNMAGRVYFI